MSLAGIVTARRAGARLRLLASRLDHDALALAALAVLGVVAVWPMVVGGDALGQDTSTQFYPWFHFLGEGLRAGRIPLWNPYQMAGTPFAADAQSGWMYWPSMVFFTLLPLWLAIKAYVLFHVLLGGFATYLLGRRIRLGVVGAAVAGVAYTYSGPLLARSPCCPNHTGVVAWLPVALLGCELGIGARGVLRRCLGWALSGFALSQVMAIWLGQGTYYVGLMVGSYLVYRSLVSPPEGVGRWRSRVTALVAGGVIVPAFAFGLAAAGLLPRFEYDLYSNLAGGYSTGKWYGGMAPLQLLTMLRTNDFWYVGGSVAALAAVSPVLARRRHLTPYWLGAVVACMTLATSRMTPLHRLAFALLPGFEQLHTHVPGRILLVTYLPIVLLAGASITALCERRDRWRYLALAPCALAVVPLLHPVHQVLWALATAVAVSLAAGLAAWSKGWREVAVALLALVVFADVFVGAHRTFELHSRIPASHGAHAFRTVDVREFYAPPDTGRYLMERARSSVFRYADVSPNAEPTQHPRLWGLARTRYLLANAEGLMLGLQSIEGYNPEHLRLTGELMGRMNGIERGYHVLGLYIGGLRSPLLDLLNVRYVVMPRDASSGWVGPTVYEGSRFKVVLNRGALPRAWLVHDALRLPDDEALDLLSSGEVNPRLTALVASNVPAMHLPRSGRAGRVEMIRYTPDYIRIRTTSREGGLLVLSEVYYPDWRGAVDGREVPVIRADYALRAIYVPRGTHVVELQYRSRWLAAGLAISALAYGMVTTVALALLPGAERARAWLVARRGRLRGGLAP